MFVKRFKRKCDVRGCKNTANVFLVSKRREMGNTIAICTDCLKEAQTSIDGYVEEKKAIKREVLPLFPHPELDVTLSSVIDEEPKPIEVIEEVTEDIPISVAEDTVARGIELDKLTNAELNELGMHRDEKGEQGESGITTTKPKTSPKKKKTNKR